MSQELLVSNRYTIKQTIINSTHHHLLFQNISKQRWHHLRHQIFSTNTSYRLATTHLGAYLTIQSIATPTNNRLKYQLHADDASKLRWDFFFVIIHVGGSLVYCFLSLLVCWFEERWE